jgi:hypothetical protein
MLLYSHQGLWRQISHFWRGKHRICIFHFTSQQALAFWGWLAKDLWFWSEQRSFDLGKTGSSEGKDEETTQVHAHYWHTEKSIR